MSTEDPAAAEPPVEEQVVGVLKYCDVCEEKTVHVDGVCRDHQIRRVRRKRPVAEASAPVRRVARPVPSELPATPSAPARRRVPAKPKKTSRLRYIVALVVIAGFIVAAGSFHVIHGSQTSIHICAKNRWSLADTIVNLDDYPAGTLVPFDLEQALSACQLPPPKI